MKGYFSRIAKQSGLRYSGHGPDTSGAIRPDSRSSPFEREETVMVSPSFPEASAVRQHTSRTNAAENLAQSPVPQKGRIDEYARPDTEKKPHLHAKPSQVSDEARETVSEEPQMVTQRSENDTGRSSPEDESDRPAGPIGGDLPAVEQTVFVKSGERGQSTKSAPRVLGSTESAEPTELITTEFVPPPEPKKREYFAKTAELIGKAEKGDRDPAEIQNIVLQEVQEWVAASPVNTETPDLGDAKPPEVVVLREFEHQTEPGVVTIREDARPEPSEKSQLAEQSFELSIGTISVVIDEPEKSKQPEPPLQKANDQSRGGETKRKYSRLSKHYI